MSNRFWNRQVSRIERAGNDDFLLILTGGAAAYATHELHQLLRRLRLESVRLGNLRRLSFRLGICIPVMLTTATLAALFGLIPVVYGTLAALFVLLLFLSATVVHRRGRLSCGEREKRLRHIIQQELERRRMDAGAELGKEQ
jgi:hypothetical protein